MFCATAYASSFSCSFSIPTQAENTWNGKDEKELWLFSTTNTATFKTKIEHGSDITSELMMVRVFLPDLYITGYNVSSGSRQSDFVPQTTNGYYAVITAHNLDGVNGTVEAYN